MLCKNKECHTSLGIGTVIKSGKMPDGRSWEIYQAKCPICQTVTTMKYIERRSFSVEGKLSSKETNIQSVPRDAGIFIEEPK